MYLSTSTKYKYCSWPQPWCTNIQYQLVIRTIYFSHFIMLTVSLSILNDFRRPIYNCLINVFLCQHNIIHNSGNFVFNVMTVMNGMKPSESQGPAGLEYNLQSSRACTKKVCTHQPVHICTHLHTSAHIRRYSPQILHGLLAQCLLEYLIMNYTDVNF